MGSRPSPARSPVKRESHLPPPSPARIWLWLIVSFTYSSLFLTAGATTIEETFSPKFSPPDTWDTMEAGEHGILPDTGENMQPALQVLLQKAGERIENPQRQRIIVTLGAGEYRIEGEELSLPSGVGLWGSGPATILKLGAFDPGPDIRPVIRLDDVSHTLLGNLTLDTSPELQDKGVRTAGVFARGRHSRASSYHRLQSLLIFGANKQGLDFLGDPDNDGSRLEHLWVEDVTVLDTGLAEDVEDGTAVFAEDTHRLFMSDLRIRNTRRDGIKLNEGVENAWIQNVLINPPLAAMALPETIRSRAQALWEPGEHGNRFGLYDNTDGVLVLHNMTVEPGTVRTPLKSEESFDETHIGVFDGQAIYRDWSDLPDPVGP